MKHNVAGLERITFFYLEIVRILKFIRMGGAPHCHQVKKYFSLKTKKRAEFT